MTLTKDRLVSSIGNRLGISKFESLRILESVLETVKTSISNGEDVLISGFGKFIARKKAATTRTEPGDRRGFASWRWDCGYIPVLGDFEEQD